MISDDTKDRLAAGAVVLSLMLFCAAALYVGDQKGAMSYNSPKKVRPAMVFKKADTSETEVNQTILMNLNLNMNVPMSATY